MIFYSVKFLGQGGSHSRWRRRRPHQGALRTRRQLPQVRHHGRHRRDGHGGLHQVHAVRLEPQQSIARGCKQERKLWFNPDKTTKHSDSQV